MKLLPYFLLTLIAFSLVDVPILPSIASSEKKAFLDVNNENKPIINTDAIDKNLPNRLSITIQIDSPDDLKISEGMELKKDQIIATRDRRKTELNRQKQQLQLSLNKLKSFQPLPPTIPTEIPPLKALPPISYLEYESAVESAQTNIQFIEEEIKNKEQEIDFYHNLAHVDNNIINHEKAKLKEIQKRHTLAIKNYQLALGKLETAKNNRNYAEYEASLDKVRRIEQLNLQQQNYERDLTLFQQRKAEQEFRITQVNNNLADVQEKLNQLSNTTSPYNGTVRRIKWLGQSPDGVLTAEVSLIVHK